MPICQPPAGKTDTGEKASDLGCMVFVCLFLTHCYVLFSHRQLIVTDKPGSVGVPVAASLAIVSRTHLRIQPYGIEGEIAIQVGQTVMQNYLENRPADAKAYFYLNGSRW